MSLNFDSAGSNRSVNHGSGASIDDLPAAGAFSYAGWFYRTSDGDNQYMFDKGTVGLAVCTNAPGEGAIQCAVIRASPTNFITASGVLPLNTWKFIVMTFDDAASPKVHVYHGTTSTAMAEASYGTTTAGSGAIGSDAASDQIIGNTNALNLPFRGRIDGAAIWSTVISAANAEVLRNLCPDEWDTVGTCKLAAQYHVVASIPDLSGNSNTGTITSATLAASGIGVMTAPDPADAAWFFSPYNWYSDGGGALSSNNIKASSTYAKTNNTGAYCKVKVVVGSDADANGNVALHLNNSALSATLANNPSIGVSIDNGPLTLTTLPVSVPTNWRQPIATGLAAGTHEIKVWFKSLDLNTTGDRWATPTRAITILGLEADYSATLSACTLGSKNLLAVGDSQFEGANNVGSGLLVADTDTTQTISVWFAEAFDAEYGIVAFGGIGWTKGIGNVTASSSAPSVYNTTDANESWNKYFSGQSRLVTGAFSPVPDYILTDLGGNDAALSSTPVTDCLNEWRTAAGSSCWIFGIPPVAQQNVAAITTGFGAVSDTSKTKFITPTLTITVGTASLWSNDAGAGSQHLNVRGHARWAAETIKLAQAQILAASGGGLIVNPGLSGRLI